MSTLNVCIYGGIIRYSSLEILSCVFLYAWRKGTGITFERNLFSSYKCLHSSNILHLSACSLKALSRIVADNIYIFLKLFFRENKTEYFT